MKRLAMILAACATAGAAATVALAQPPAVAPEQPAPVQVPAPVPAQPQVVEEQAPMIATSSANLRALDKITGNAKDFSARVGEAWSFGRLKGTVRACYQSRPQDTPESAAFLEIRDNTPVKTKQAKPGTPERVARGPKPIGPDGLLFSGWMFASSPGLSALEHPTYDVWVINCSASAP
jgi:hypothetical protein